jgi:hypothetical protein
MKVGDLVLYRPDTQGPGVLARLRHLARTVNKIGNDPGIIIEHHRQTALVLFGGETLACDEESLEIITANELELKIRRESHRSVPPNEIHQSS